MSIGNKARGSIVPQYLIIILFGKIIIKKKNNSIRIIRKKKKKLKLNFSMIINLNLNLTLFVRNIFLFKLYNNNSRRGSQNKLQVCNKMILMISFVYTFVVVAALVVFVAILSAIIKVMLSLMTMTLRSYDDVFSFSLLGFPDHCLCLNHFPNL